MADCFDAQTRHRVMQRIHSKDTSLEKKVRKALRAMGERYWLNRKGLPGSPDIVLPRRNAVILINGCFWHQHPGCKHSRKPKSNLEYWNKKFEQNRMRDERNMQKLKEMGWRIVVVWECQILKKGQVEPLLENLLAPLISKVTASQPGLFE